MIDANLAVQSVSVSVARSVPASATAIGIGVATKGTVPRQIGMTRAELAEHGFSGKAGETLAIPSSNGLVVALGLGDAGEIDATALRNAGASFVRAAAKHGHLATTLGDVDDVDAAVAGQAVTEGVLLASYRYVGLKNAEDAGSKLSTLTLVVGSKRVAGVESGSSAGRVVANAATFARELANTPPTYLNAKDLAAKALELGPDAGLKVEVFNKDDLKAMGCGGIIGVNRGSTQPPRMIKLTFAPRNPKGHLAMVGKGIMYDSGGISLKPSDAFHQVMKMDMSGAAAVLSTMRLSTMVASQPSRRPMPPPARKPSQPRITLCTISRTDSWPAIAPPMPWA